MKHFTHLFILLMALHSSAYALQSIKSKCMRRTRTAAIHQSSAYIQKKRSFSAESLIPFIPLISVSITALFARIFDTPYQKKSSN